MRAPSVRRSILILIAGLVWSVVGLVLIIVAARWLWVVDKYAAPALLLGLLAGWFVYVWGFSGLVRKNLERIRQLAPEKDRICVFAFQHWRSYLIVIIMIILGYTLRHLPVDRVWIAPVYLAVGLGLTLASLHYYTHVR
jgi:energy-coupling factor transporter transmembrane protein EcfT